MLHNCKPVACWNMMSTAHSDLPLDPVVVGPLMGPATHKMMSSCVSEHSWSMLLPSESINQCSCWRVGDKGLEEHLLTRHLLSLIDCEGIKAAAFYPDTHCEQSALITCSALMVKILFSTSLRPQNLVDCVQLGTKPDKKFHWERQVCFQIPESWLTV